MMPQTKVFRSVGLVVLLGAISFPQAVWAATILSTSTANNGSGGIFLDLTAAGLSLTVNSFDTYFGATAGTAGEVEVYTRPGSYVGFNTANTGWTLIQNINFISQGTTTLANVSFATGISIVAGQTVGVYLHSITPANGIRYNGTGVEPPQTTWSNADLTLFSSDVRTGSVAFDGSAFSPRTFAGNVNYTLDSEVPEPSSIALLGAGLAGMAWLRRKRA